MERRVFHGSDGFRGTPAITLQTHFAEVCDNLVGAAALKECCRLRACAPVVAVASMPTCLELSLRRRHF
jgi:hypothetical protein